MCIRDRLQRLCDPAADILKLSVRDVGVALALHRDGATTVASTSALAHRAGISVFATGGLGGVHRGAAETFDVSADLGVIARTPVPVSYTHLDVYKRQLLFLAFPKAFASGFSGFYLALMIMLWLLMGRGLAFELREHVDLRLGGLCRDWQTTRLPCGGRQHICHAGPCLLYTSRCV